MGIQPNADHQEDEHDNAFLESVEHLEAADLMDLFQEKRGELQVLFEPWDHEEAEEALALFIEMLQSETKMEDGNLTTASEFLSVMVGRNHLVAVKLTHLLADKYIKKSNGQHRNERDIVRAWHQFYSQELAHLGVMKRREHIGKPYNKSGTTIKNWIAEAEPLVAARHKRMRAAIGRQMDGLEERQGSPLQIGRGARLHC